MADEDDYMSDIFTQHVDVHESNLIKDRQSLRKRKLERNKSDFDLKNKVKPKHILEHEQRQKGLATSLSNDNLGFKLMAKMGYKSGEGLGKKGEGRSEPVPVEIKANRFGLGKESTDKAKMEVRKQLMQIVAEKKLKLDKILQNDFRARMSKKFSLMQIERDLSKSQNACLQLDSVEEMEEPIYDFFWPNHMAAEPDPDEDEDPVVDEYSPEDKLAMLTSYLRRQYCYCIWCASKFEDIDDMVNSCPGDNAAAHED